MSEPGVQTPSQETQNASAEVPIPKTEGEKISQKSGFDNLEHLIFDAGAFIDGFTGSFYTKISNAIHREEHPLILYTTEEVIKEVKDPQSRKTLAFFQDYIKVRTPTPEALNAVVEFAKKTGDFASLSVNDLKVMALTWMVEKEVNGNVDHIHTEPKRKIKSFHHAPLAQANDIKSEEQVESAEIKTETPQPSVAEAQPVSDACHEHDHQEENGKEEVDSASNDDDGFQVVQSKPKKEPKQPITKKKNKKKKKRSTPVAAPESDVADSSKSETTSVPSTNEAQSSAAESASTAEASTGSSASTAVPSNVPEADEGEWITSDNIHKFNAAFGGKSLAENVRKIGCMTTDYSMQNVLLQMNMNLLATDGRTLRKVKQWILRCYGCNKTTREMERKFCPSCGNSSLIRIPVITTSKGREIIVGNGRLPTLRGTIFALPKPQGGKNAANPILNEDEYQKALRATRSKKGGVDAFDADFEFAGSKKGPGHNIRLGDKAPPSRKSFGKKNKNFN